jgi:hypothetical protein
MTDKPHLPRPEDAFGFSTRAIHAGQTPDPTTGAVMQPIYATSTFKQSSPGVHTGYEYARSGNPTRRAYEECLASLEGAAHGGRHVIAGKTDQVDKRPHQRFETRKKSPLRRQQKAGLAGDHNAVATMTERAAEKPFALPLAVDVRGVEEVDAGVERDGEEVHELVGILLENAAEARTSQPKRRHLEIRATKASEREVSSVGSQSPPPGQCYPLYKLAVRAIVAQ